MPISPIKSGNSAISFYEATPTKAALCHHRDKLAEKIRDIKNTLSELSKSATIVKKSINTDVSLLKSLESVSKKHGEDACVRLKGDKFKYGQANNIFKKALHGSRYQLERQAAVEKLGLQGKDASVSISTSTLNGTVSAEHDKLQSLTQDIEKNKKQLTDVENNKFGIEDKLRAIAKGEIAEKKADEQNRKKRDIFSAIYQSNAGCRALNTEARVQSGHQITARSLSDKDVLQEYERVHGDNIFGKGNKDLKYTIQANCRDLSELTKTAAKAWYTPTSKNITTYRGQGMTETGINTLIKQFNEDTKNNSATVYALGQFFSTSTKIDVARGFASRSQDDVKVIFKTKGNSSNGLSVPGGLAFDNDEGERLYSPLANVKVTHITKTPSGTYNVVLEEVNRKEKAPLLPY